MTGVLSLVVIAAIIRDPRPRGPRPRAGRVGHVVLHVHDPDARALRVRGAHHPGAAAVPIGRLRWLWLAFGVVFTLNLLAAVPPTPEIGALLPVRGPLGIAGAIAMTALCLGRWC